MKKCIVFLLILSSFAFVTTEPIQITQNGFSNFLLGKTSLSTIVKRYPPDPDNIHYGNVESVFIPEQGIQLYFTHKDGVPSESTFLNQIDITNPCYASTEKNIRIGSTVDEVVLQYGMQKDYQNSKLLVYDWIVFYIENKRVNRISISSK